MTRLLTWILCLGVSLCAAAANVCHHPKKIGPCKGSFPRYFYNSDRRRCEYFRWGGCKANENNFLSKRKCRKTCKNVCSRPPMAGSCKERTERWYFDATQNRCETFSYSGCGGNGNNFISKQDCEQSCKDYVFSVCSEPMKPGPCKAAKPRFYFNTKINNCQIFTWGGCKPNGNNFISLIACNNTCNKFVCSLPVKVGPCKAAKRRYYYDKTEGNCKDFLWGGCKPNGNNFKTLMACENKCT